MHSIMTERLNCVQFPGTWQARDEGACLGFSTSLAQSESDVGPVPRQPPQSRTRTRQYGPWLLIVAWLTMAPSIRAGETWQAALAQMPLGTNITELNRSNCVSLILNAFQSNTVVKALIFTPGATDEFYFYRRASAKLTDVNPSLLDAIVALTNQTYIRAMFRPPLLVLRTSEDVTNVIAVVKSKSTATKLQRKIIPERVVFNDATWDQIRSALARKLSIGLRPFSNSPDSWHFYRHNFAACGVTEWEMLEASALAGKTRFTVHWRTVDFQLDQRNGPVPSPKTIRMP